MRHSSPRVDDSLKTLERYAEAFRDLVNAKVWPAKGSPSKALRLNSPSDWEFICVAMDVVGDAALAIADFLRFSLDGPTRYENTGERYLRLYGLLSASYVQQEAVRKLYALMNCQSPKQVDESFAQLDLRTLRHQVASHSVDYRVPGTTQLLSFVPVRIGLSGYSCMVTEGRGTSTRTVDLGEAVDTHCKAISDVLDRIYAKSIRTLFRGQNTKIAEFEAKLADLRAMRDGTLIIRAVVAGGSPSEIRVHLVAPAKSKRATSQMKPRPRTRARG